MSTINRDSEATYDELNPHASILLEENLLPQRKNPYPNEDSVAALASA